MLTTRRQEPLCFSTKSKYVNKVPDSQQSGTFSKPFLGSIQCLAAYALYMIAWACRWQRGDRCQTFVFTFLNVSPESFFSPLRSMDHINKSLHCSLTFTHCLFVLVSHLPVSNSCLDTESYTHTPGACVGTGRHESSNQIK